MKLAIALVTVIGFAASAEAQSFKVPTKPLRTGVVCTDSGIDVLAMTSSETGAAVKITNGQKTETVSVQASKTGNIVTYASAVNGKLDVNFDRTIPGSESVLGELDMEFDGQRIRVDIPCRLLFMAGKQPSLTAWQ